MSRIIKFRGLTIDNDQHFEYGDLINKNKKSYIYFYDCNNFECIYEVDKETLGQFTGLCDKNGKEIYEGDIVEINGKKYSIKFEIGSFVLVRCSQKTDMFVEFASCWNDDVFPLSQFYWDSNDEEYTLSNCEIIGNIYENKELLEGEVNE